MSFTIFFKDDFNRTLLQGKKKEKNHHGKLKRPEEYLEKCPREYPLKYPSKYLLEYLSKYNLKAIVRRISL